MPPDPLARSRLGNRSVFILDPRLSMLLRWFIRKITKIGRVFAQDVPNRVWKRAFYTNDDLSVSATLTKPVVNAYAS